jgi:predicted exporter
LFAVVLLLGLASATGLQVSFLHLVGLLLVIAICADYGIFYQENPDGKLHLTYHSIFTSMLTSAGAFGCLAIAQSAILKTLGECVMLGVIIGFLLCPILIKHPRQ